MTRKIRKSRYRNIRKSRSIKIKNYYVEKPNPLVKNYYIEKPNPVVEKPKPVLKHYYVEKPKLNLIEKVTQAKGDCFFSSLYRSLIYNEYYNDFIDCINKKSKINFDKLNTKEIKNNPNFSSEDYIDDKEKNFIHKMRQYFSLRNDFINNMVYNLIINRETIKEHYKDQSGPVRKFVKSIESLEPLIKKYKNDDIQKMVDNMDQISNELTDGLKKIIVELRKNIATYNEYAGEFEFEFAKNLLSLCGIKLHILSKIELPKSYNSKDKNIMIINRLDSQHYKYVVIE